MENRGEKVEAGVVVRGPVVGSSMNAEDYIRNDSRTLAQWEERLGQIDVKLNEMLAETALHVGKRPESRRNMGGGSIKKLEVSEVSNGLEQNTSLNT